MDLSRVAIVNDIYLYHWIYYMRPIVDKNETYERFLTANNWVSVDEEQKMENQKYTIPGCIKAVISMGFGGRNWLSQIENSTKIAKWTSFSPPNAFDTFGTKSMENGVWKESIYKKLNTLIRYFLLPRTQRRYEKLWKPEWVIISDQMLKFHDTDKRKTIRDTILEKYFDK